MKPKNYTISFTRKNRIRFTRDNWLHVEYMGQETPEGAEAEIPQEIIRAEERAARKAEKRLRAKIDRIKNGEQVGLTTEELGQWAIWSVQKMTPEEKAQLRKILDAAFLPCPPQIN